MPSQGPPGSESVSDPAGAWSPGCGRPWTELHGRTRCSSVVACEQEAWTLATWRLDGQGEALAAPLLCGSWRCRRCARWRGAVDWTRISRAVTSRSWWLYAVLTFNPAEYLGSFQAYKLAGEVWDHGLRRAIERQIRGRAADRATLFADRAGERLEYVQTWERHRNGWPHVNVMLTSPNLRAIVEAWGVESRRHGKTGRWCRFPKRWRGWLREKAVKAGFGRSVWVEVIDDQHGAEAMSNYLVKLARELTGAVEKQAEPGAGGELGDGGQSPLNAPVHFRRIRTSRSLLPKAEKPEALKVATGRMIQADHGRRVRLEAGGPDDPGPRRTGERPGLPVEARRLEAWLRAEGERLGEAWAERLNQELEAALLRGSPLVNFEPVRWRSLSGEERSSWD